MIKRLQVLFIFFFVIASFRFFDARFLNEHFTNYFVFLYVICVIILSIPYIFAKPTGFIFPIQLIILSILASMIMANLSWGQSLEDTIIVTVPLLSWFFFFYLLHEKISVEIIEVIILIYGIIYIFLYFYQLTHTQTILFGRGDDFLEERGAVRILMAGGGMFFLASFLALNKLTTQKRGRILWLSLTILGLLIPFLQATRQFIAGVILIYLFHFVKNKTLYKKVIILTSFIALIIFIGRSDNAIVRGIIEAQEETVQAGTEDIRVLSGTYFLTEFSPNNINRLLGNGVPYGENSDYGIFVDSLKQEGYYMADIGIIAVYAMFGILAVIAYIIMWIRSVNFPIPHEYYYLKYYLWFLLITCLTSDNLYSYNYLISTVFALYIYQIMYTEQVAIKPAIE